MVDRDTFSVGYSIVNHTFIHVGRLGSLGIHVFCFVLFLNNIMESKAWELTALVHLKAAQAAPFELWGLVTL